GGLGPRRGLPVWRRHRQRVGAGRRGVPSCRAAIAHRVALFRPRHRAHRQEPAGAARRPALSRHAGRVPGHAAGPRPRSGETQPELRRMTPSGAIAFAAIVISGAMWSGDIRALTVLLALCVAFGIIETGWTMRRAFAWPAAIVAPLALFMAIVWIGIVAR